MLTYRLNGERKGKTMKKFIILALTLVLCVSLSACSDFVNGVKDGLNTDKPETSTTQENTPKATPDAEPSEEAAIESDDQTSAFNPQDVSDETIASISTYDDYLLMYQMIIEDYFVQYEAAIKDTVLYSEETFAGLKKGYYDAFEQQKEAYGQIGKMKIVGKDTLVDFLISYRDSLKEAVESIVESLNIG
jgi:hypothetical protein